MSIVEIEDLATGVAMKWWELLQNLNWKSLHMEKESLQRNIVDFHEDKSFYFCDSDMCWQASLKAIFF